MSLQSWAALVIITLTLMSVAAGHLPRLRMNRATIALVGATALIVIGAIPLQDAYAALDTNTLSLLFGVMVLNVNLRLAGFFRVVAWRLSRWARSPYALLALVIGESGVLSAFFLNDTIALMFTPLVLEIAATLGLNPTPCLIGIATAANIGSTATITGNPQNMIIGIASGIPCAAFAARLISVALGGLVVAWGVIILLYRRDFAPGSLRPVALRRPSVYQPLLLKGLAAATLMTLALFAGAPIPLAALGAAALLLISRRIKPQRVFGELG